jgi:tripartite ATP-independent transporter DctP family solute receptor
MSLASMAVLASWLAVTPAQAQKVQGKLSTVAVAGDPIHGGLVLMVERIKELTKGDVQLAVFGSSQLGGEADVITGLKLGSIEAGSITTSVFASLAPEVGVIDMPFIFRNEEHALLSYPVLTQRLGPKLQAQGYRLLGTTLSGVRHPASTFPIRSIEDVQGKKMRVLQNPIHIEAWKLAGANPTPIPFPEVYNALQTKVVDFADLPKGFYVSVKWNEVAKHFTELGHIYALNFIVVSDRFWKKLSPEQQTSVQTAADEAVLAIHNGVVKGDEQAIANAVQAGSTLHTVPDKEPWRKRMVPIWDDFRKRVPEGGALIEALQSLNGPKT